MIKFNHLRDVMGRLKHRFRKNYGVAWITPYIICNVDGDATEDIKVICRKIAAKLDEYQDVMVAYGEKENSPWGFSRLQQISANYDTYTGNIDVVGTGNKSFWWNGKLEEFLGDKLNLPELLLTNS